MQPENTDSDSLRRFVFDHMDARGCIVRLADTCAAIQATHHYPPALARLLNQFAAAVALLRDSIKIDASVSLQLRGPGPLQLIMADCMSDRALRAIAEYDAQQLPAHEVIDFQELAQEAILAITITPDQGERYQAIVPIEHPDLEQCLEQYFQRSEQLPSCFRLLADGSQALGIAIHSLPAQLISDPEQAKENFERLKALLATLDGEEAAELDSQQILTRLFHQESCRLFKSQPLRFGCQCSVDKSLAAIKALGADDLAALVSEQQAEGKDKLVVDCHFCFQRYEFEFDQVVSFIQ